MATLVLELRQHTNLVRFPLIIFYKIYMLIAMTVSTTDYYKIRYHVPVYFYSNVILTLDSKEENIVLAWKARTIY
jgi:hypothetical protein